MTGVATLDQFIRQAQALLLMDGRGVAWRDDGKTRQTSPICLGVDYYYYYWCGSKRQKPDSPNQCMVGVVLNNDMKNLNLIIFFYLKHIIFGGMPWHEDR